MEKTDLWQSRCLEFLDDLVERGVDITNLSKELPEKEYHSARKRIHRAFGTMEKAIEAFGLTETNGYPEDYELYRCYYINDKYEIVTNEYEKEFVCDIYNLSEVDFKRLSAPLMKDLRKDALDEFYRHEFPDNIKSSFVESEEYKHVWGYIKSVYGSVRKLMEFYGTPSEIFVDYDYCGWDGVSIQKGHTFESIVKDMLEVIFDNVQYHAIFDGCRPDFVIGDRWYDAKLSAYAPFHPKNTMLERYLKNTNDLTIIYAKRKRSPYKRSGAKFIHVSELYSDLEVLGRSDLIERCEIFLDSLNEKKAVS